MALLRKLVIFRKRAMNYRALLRKMIYTDDPHREDARKNSTMLQRDQSSGVSRSDGQAFLDAFLNHQLRLNCNITLKIEQTSKTTHRI